MEEMVKCCNLQGWKMVPATEPLARDRETAAWPTLNTPSFCMHAHTHTHVLRTSRARVLRTRRLLIHLRPELVADEREMAMAGPFTDVACALDCATQGPRPPMQLAVADESATASPPKAWATACGMAGMEV